MRRIYLDKLRIQANIGILEHELLSKQPLLVSLTVDLPDAPILPAADEIIHVFDYRKLRDIALEETSQGHVNLLETLAGRIANRIIELKAVHQVIVRVDKPNIFPDCDGVGVEVTRVKRP
jgi:7,8-dihydroneopterin aldolase/epimerase/oxygenase